MIHADRVIASLLITEKANEASSNFNQYTFKINPGANRIVVAQAVEKTFGVKVARVNIINVKPKTKPQRLRRGRTGSKSGYKKALVTLKEGSIDLL